MGCMTHKATMKRNPRYQPSYRSIVALALMASLLQLGQPNEDAPGASAPWF